MKVIYKRWLAFGIILCLACYLLAMFPFGTKQAYAARYSGYGEAATRASKEYETINYTSREETYIETVKGVPLYTQLSDYPNSCGAVGGAIIVGFYDKYYNDLIPNYSSSVSSGAYKRADNVYVPQLIGDLYSLMRTNVDDVGVSEADCLTGLRTYVLNKGRTLWLTSIVSSGTVNESAYKNAINNNTPSLVFCDKMELCNWTTGSNSVTIEKTTYVGAHIVVAYGFLEVKYYNGSSCFRTEKYLQIATGLETTEGRYINIGNTDWCNAAYAVTVS